MQMQQTLRTNGLQIPPPGAVTEPSTEHRGQSTEHRTQSRPRAQSIEHKAQSTEHRAQRVPLGTEQGSSNCTAGPISTHKGQAEQKQGCPPGKQPFPPWLGDTPEIVPPTHTHRAQLIGPQHQGLPTALSPTHKVTPGGRGPQGAGHRERGSDQGHMSSVSHHRGWGIPGPAVGPWLGYYPVTHKGTWRKSTGARGLQSQRLWDSSKGEASVAQGGRGIAFN